MINGNKSETGSWGFNNYWNMVHIVWKDILWIRWKFKNTNIIQPGGIRNSFIEIKFLFHKIHPFKVYNLIFFIIFTQLFNHHLHFNNFRTFSSPQEETLCLSTVIPILPISCEKTISIVLSLESWLYLIFHTNGIILFVGFFWDWLLSYSKS